MYGSFIIWVDHYRQQQEHSVLDQDTAVGIEGSTSLARRWFAYIYIMSLALFHDQWSLPILPLYGATPEEFDKHKVSVHASIVVGALKQITCMYLCHTSGASGTPLPGFALWRMQGYVGVQGCSVLRWLGRCGAVARVIVTDMSLE